MNERTDRKPEATGFHPRVQKQRIDVRLKAWMDNVIIPALVKQYQHILIQE